MHIKINQNPTRNDCHLEFYDQNDLAQHSQFLHIKKGIIFHTAPFRKTKEEQCHCLSVYHENSYPDWIPGCNLGITLQPKRIIWSIFCFDTFVRLTCFYIGYHICKEDRNDSGCLITVNSLGEEIN